MLPAIRTQVDGEQELHSLESGITCTAAEDMTRQEKEPETRTDVILGRFTPGGFSGAKPPVYQEVDFNLDLQQALTRKRVADRAFNRLPQTVRDKYRDWEHVAAAINAGTFDKKDLEPPAKDVPSAPPSVPPTP